MQKTACNTKNKSNESNKNNNRETKTEKHTGFEGFHYDDKRKSKLKTIKTFVTWDELFSVEHALFVPNKLFPHGREDMHNEIVRVWKRLCREMERKTEKKTKNTARLVGIQLSENDMDLIEDLFFVEMNNKVRAEHFEKTKRVYLELCKAGKRKREIIELGRNEKIGIILHAVLEKEGIGKSECCCINVLEVPGAVSQGDTKEEAIEMVKEALELVLEEI